MPFRAGESYGQYDVVSLLETGGTGAGVAWRARDTRLGRDVAIKVLPATFVSDPERRRQFEAEARAAGQLNHANVLTIYDLGEYDGALCLVTELLEGETLREVLDQGKLPPRRAIEIAVQVARGLAAAHERGVVHRDLRPRNLFVTTDGRVKILDFGVAGPVAGEGIAGTFFGTPGYMAPEQVRGEQADARSDVWALGCILYEMLAGHPPFAGATEADTVSAILNDEPPRLTQPPATVPRHLAMVVEHCLEKRPNERFQSARDLCFSLGQLSGRSASGRVEVGARASSAQAAGLARAAAEARATAAEARASAPASASSREALSPPPSVSPYPAPAAAAAASRAAAKAAAANRPSRLFALVAMATLGAVLVVEAWTGWVRIRAARPKPAAAPHASSTAGALAPLRVVPFTFTGLDHSPAASPDGKRVAFVSTRDGTPRIWTSPVDEGKELALTEGPDDSPRFSPDGASILFARRTPKGTGIWRIPASGGEPRRIVDDAFEADWSPDGARVAFLRQVPALDHSHGVVGIAQADGSGEHELAPFVDCVLGGVRWSRDGRKIAVTRIPSGRGDPDLLLVDPSTGKEEVLPSPAPHARLTTATWSRESLAFGWTAGPSAGSPGPALVVRRPPGRGPAAGLFWADGLFGGSATRPPVVEWLGPDPDRFVFDSERVRQALAIVSLGPAGGGGAGAAPRAVAGSGARQAAYPTPLTFGGGIDRQPVFSPDGKRVVFSSSRGGTFELWTIGLEALDSPRVSALAGLSGRRANEREPAFSPDGREIAWSSETGGVREIWAADVDGGRARQVSHDGVDAGAPTWTRDGRWIVYASGNPEKAGLWRIRPDGSGASHLLPGYWTLPEVSPDGRTVLAVGSADGSAPLRPDEKALIGFVDLPTGRRLPLRIEIPLRAEYAAGPGRPRWSRDGSAVLFLGEDDRGRSGIYRQDFRTDGRDTWRSRGPVAGFYPGVVTESFSLSPDGTRAVLSLQERSRVIQATERAPGR